MNGISGVIYINKILSSLKFRSQILLVESRSLTVILS